tara:strand:- start:1 stop:729 length:729 start_codon:yes stop_codon:yes gene_type:complete
MIYKRPVFTLFTEQKQIIESTGDPNIGRAMNAGKLLASGEAGYYDQKNQSHEVNRFNSNGTLVKPTGQGIDYHYPNPPEAIPAIINGKYWGLPEQNNNFSYYQSGIFVDKNDDSPHLDGKFIDYYYKQGLVSLHSGIFNYNEVSGKFSNAYDTQKLPNHCLPKPLVFSVTKPLFLSREMYMIHPGSGNPVRIPYLGDYDIVKKIEEEEEGYDSCKNFESDIEKFIAGENVIRVTEEEENNDN